MCLAVPGKVMEILGDDPLTRSARVAFAGVLKEISLALLPDTVVGEHVLVHAGFAMARVDASEVRRIDAQLDALDALDPLGATGPIDLDTQGATGDART